MAKYQIETTAPNGKPIVVPIPDGFLDQIRDEYAHELAEKIRNMPEPEYGLEGVGRRDAADLIDPKVTAES